MDIDKEFEITVSNFRRALADDLGVELQLNTIDNVKRTVAKIQDQQTATLQLRDMSRIEAFLSKLESLEAGMKQYKEELNPGFELVWMSVRKILEITSQHSTSFSDVLEAFKELGQVLPTYHSSLACHANHNTLAQLLILTYAEISRFLLEVMRLVSHHSWRQLFRPLWNEFKCFHLKHLVDRFRRFSALLDDSFKGYNVTDQVNNQFMDVRYDEARRRQEEQTRRHTIMANVRDWINGTSPEASHETFSSTYRKSPASGEWVMETKQVNGWVFDEIPQRPLLWLHGIPGAGKTVLASKIIDECLKHRHSQTAYFYCLHDDRDTHTALSVFKGILSQNIHHFSHLSAYFDDVRRQHSGPHLIVDRLAQQLLEILAYMSDRQYIIIDGLDECAPDYRKTILKFFVSLVQNVDKVKPGCLRLLVVSQNEPDLQHHMAPGEILGLTAADNQSDIAIFIASEMEKIQPKFNLSTRDAELLRNRICVQTDGQFLFAKLVLENLFHQVNRKRFAREIENDRLPKKLQDAYDRIIERIRSSLEETEWEIAILFLGWMTCAKRPLKWWEIQGAMSIDLENNTVDYEERQSRRHARELCGSLVYEQGGHVRLVHSTAKRYILKSDHIDSAAVNCQLTSLCLRYLAFDCFFDYQPEHDENRYLLAGYFAFAEYASTEWPGHLEQVFADANGNQGNSEDLLTGDEFLQLCEATEELVFRHSEDFPTGDEQNSTANTMMLPQSTMLKLHQHNEDYVHFFKSLCSHIMTHRDNFSNHSRQISLMRVQETITSTRMVTERLISVRATSISISEMLIKMYGPKLYKCSKAACYYFHEGFTDRGIRDRHERLHNRQYECRDPQCTVSEFGFTSKYDLKRHIESFHADADIKMDLFSDLAENKVKSTKWQCSKCNKSFVRNGILKSHLLAHEGKRPFECSHCGQAFTRKYDCTRHEKGHENESTHIAKRRRVQNPRYDNVQILGDNNRLHLGDLYMDPGGFPQPIPDVY